MARDWLCGGLSIEVFLGPEGITTQVQKSEIDSGITTLSLSKH